MSVNRKWVHEKYHFEAKLQRRIIGKGNFTYRTTIELINEFFKNRKAVLDIGCGVGTIAYYLAKKGHNVRGIDISKRAINIARENARIFGLQGKIQFSVTDFPKEKITGQYDGILISEVLEHLEDDKMAVKVIYRLSRKNTMVIASSPSNKALLYRLGILKDFDMRVGHVRRYSEGEFRKLFENNGFKVKKLIKTEGVFRNFLFTNNNAGNLIKFIRGPITNVITFVDNILLRLFGESQLMLVAIKK